MESLYFLIPISLLILGVIVGLFLWSVKSGQFDDLEGPAHRILMDDAPPKKSPDAAPSEEKQEETKNGEQNSAASDSSSRSG